MVSLSFFTIRGHRVLGYIKIAMTSFPLDVIADVGHCHGHEALMPIPIPNPNPQTHVYARTCMCLQVHRGSGCDDATQTKFGPSSKPPVGTIIQRDVISVHPSVDRRSGLSLTIVRSPPQHPCFRFVQRKTNRVHGRAF